MTAMKCDHGFGFQYRFIQLQFITGWKRPQKTTQSLDITRMLQDLKLQNQLFRGINSKQNRTIRVANIKEQKYRIFRWNTECSFSIQNKFWSADGKLIFRTLRHLFLRFFQIVKTKNMQRIQINTSKFYRDLFYKKFIDLSSHKWAICGWFWDSFSHFPGVRFYSDNSTGISSFNWIKRKEILIFMWFFTHVNALEMIIIANRQLFFDWSHIFI